MSEEFMKIIKHLFVCCQANHLKKGALKKHVKTVIVHVCQLDPPG